MYVCVCVCVCVCECVCTYVCTCVCVCVHASSYLEAAVYMISYKGASVSGCGRTPEPCLET